jgi:hypothetical protein
VTTRRSAPGAPAGARDSRDCRRARSTAAALRSPLADRTGGMSSRDFSCRDSRKRLSDRKAIQAKVEEHVNGWRALLTNHVEDGRRLCEKCSPGRSGSRQSARRIDSKGKRCDRTAVRWRGRCCTLCGVPNGIRHLLDKGESPPNPGRVKWTSPSWPVGTRGVSARPICLSRA